MQSWLREKLWVASRIRTTGWTGEILYGQHHLSHAASAYFPSPFDEAAVLTLDGVGEWATTSVWRGHGNRLEPLWQIDFPHSLGLLYSVFTAFLGFEVNEGEYKLMGLAAYGRPRYVDQVRRLVRIAEDRSYRLDLRYFAYPRRPAAWLAPFEEGFGRPFPPGSLEGAVDERAADIAASVQEVTEEAILGMAERAKSLTGQRRLCVGGGVAQNVLANGRILREGLFDEVYVPSAPGDSGGALGAAAYVAHAILRAPRSRSPHAYLGPSYTPADVAAAARSSGLRYRAVDRSELIREAARMIAAGKIVGWFQGRMEFGPRALGARSILADPRDPGMKDKVNARIKYREAFRPFAPSLAIDDVPRYFEDRPMSRFMSFAARARSDARTAIPAVIHADGTSRIHTVGPDDHPVYYALLDELGRLTGHRVVLNTSFNVRGEPIVESPADAIDCFVRTDLDALFLENVILEAPVRPIDERPADQRSAAASIAVA